MPDASASQHPVGKWRKAQKLVPLHWATEIDPVSSRSGFPLGGVKQCATYANNPSLYEVRVKWYISSARCFPLFSEGSALFAIDSYCRRWKGAAGMCVCFSTQPHTQSVPIRPCSVPCITQTPNQGVVKEWRIIQKLLRTKWKLSIEWETGSRRSGGVRGGGSSKGRYSTRVKFWGRTFGTLCFCFCSL